MYNPEHYKKYRDCYRKAQKKYADRIRKEKIDRGEIKTKEQRALANEIKRKQLRFEYKHNIGGIKDKANAVYAKRYKDPEFRAAKLAYLVKYRKERKERKLEDKI